MEAAELMAKLLFSVIVNLLSFPLFITRSSIVLGTDLLMSLLSRKDNGFWLKFQTSFIALLQILNEREDEDT